MINRCHRGIAAAIAIAASAPSHAADPVRGGELYENHCTECHASKVHVRDRRKAHSPAALRGWIRRWQGTLGLGWEADDVDDVAAYLNARFYKFDKPLQQ